MGSTNRVKSVKTYWSHTKRQIWNIGEFMYGKPENSSHNYISFWQNHDVYTLYIENQIILLTVYKKNIIGLKTCMVIEYSFLFLSLYIACSYQPKIQKWVLLSWASSCNWIRITILVSTPMFSVLMIRMKKTTYWNIIKADLN